MTHKRVQLSAILSLVYLSLNSIPHVQPVSIKPADFDRYVMSCYFGGGGSSYLGSSSSSYNQQQAPPPSSYVGLSGGQNPIGASAGGYASQRLGPDGFSMDSGGGGGANQPFGRLSGASGMQQSMGNSGTYGQSLGQSSGSGGGGVGSASGFNPSSQESRLASTPFGSSGRDSLGRDSLSTLGQQIPRANTIDNFIALLSKIEAANPRLAMNPDQLIRTLLSRFRLDNYYYDSRTKTPLSEPDHRITDIIPALLSPMNGAMMNQVGGAGGQYNMMSADVFPEHLLDHDEKCSMYFMLSHFIDKTSPLMPPLASVPINQLTGPQGGQRPPSLQAAGSGYPALSANSAFGGGASLASAPNGAQRYPGPSPSFGSPATGNMNSFAGGINSNPEYNGKNPYGMNVPNPNPVQVIQSYNSNLRNQGQFSGTQMSNARLNGPPYVDGGARPRDERMATEFGVVTVGNQENAALVLNRVLMGILAASIPPQTIRQLAASIYPTQPLTNTPKIDEEIDPLFAVTLADLWAISSIPKPGKPFDIRLLGDGGHWNDSMCPTSFQLDRSSSIRFTTAELIGGLDGLNLGMFRRRMMSMRKNIRLSELLRMYYSRTGFRPQFAEVGVCNRATAINTQLDDLHRQAENYLRLYQLNLPTGDNEISSSINRLDAFKDIARQVANQFAPPEVCQESSFNDVYPMSPQDQCEIARADVVTVLDSSPQSNQQFMNMVVVKLAQKLNLGREGSSLSVLTNQQDTTGYAGAYSFNAIVRNSTNTAEIGCSLVHDRSQSYQGGQVTDPVRLMEMFERALINLDTEYLTRQTVGQQSSMFRQTSSSFISSLYQGGIDQQSSYMFGGGSAPKNTGGAKVIIWFNYGPQQRLTQIAPSPTNWNSVPPGSSQSSSNGDNEYRFQEAKRYLRENFRGAQVLAISASKEQVKMFVYDEDRDIFTDIPQGNEGAFQSSSGDLYSQMTNNDPSMMAQLAGPSDQLVNKLLQRMCEVPAMFQYPMCFRGPSEGTSAVGYISPSRKQYWMMSPKTFFASRAVRMAFKVDGGRLKVCFGRQPKPDETFARSGQNQQQQQYLQPNSISLSSNGNANNINGNQQQQAAGIAIQSKPVTASSSDYYTGMEYGVCKDVSPGQEIDFIVSDPCYKKTIAECEPFYYVIKEISNPGEGDPNYMCRDEGCKRFDQVKFVMTHTGVTCSSAMASIQANWLLLLISLGLTTSCFSNIGYAARSSILPMSCMKNRLDTKFSLASILTISSGTLLFVANQVSAQQANVYDYGQGRYGEKRGSFTPSEWLAIILVIMTILGGLALTICLCYYVAKRANSGMQQVETEDY